jgi:hypothetical protein
MREELDRGHDHLSHSLTSVPTRWTALRDKEVNGLTQGRQVHFQCLELIRKAKGATPI